MNHSLDWWLKVAQTVQGFSAPVLALIVGAVTIIIQIRQTATQRDQGKTQHLQYRLALMDRRMKVFNATMEFIGLVLREAQIKSLEPLSKLKRETSESDLLFGTEVSEYIDELFKKGNRLRTISATRSTGGAMRPQDIAVDSEINTWFSAQAEQNLARDKFLKYLDFRQP